MIKDLSTGTRVKTSLGSTALAMGFYTAVAIAKLYQSTSGEHSGLHLVLWMTETIVLALFTAGLIAWNVKRFGGSNDCSVQALGLFLTLTHALVHYIPEKETYVDYLWHTTQAVFGAHNVFFRQKMPRLGRLYTGLHVFFSTRQVRFAVHQEPQVWGDYMMARSFATGLLTMDGIVAPLATAINFATRGTTHDIVFTALWVFGFVATVAYMTMLDGYGFAMFSLYGVWIEYVTITVAILFSTHLSDKTAVAKVLNESRAVLSSLIS